MKILISSPTHGIVEVLMDEEDYIKFKDHKFYVWGTKRHYSLYLNGYAPGNKRDSLRMHRIIMNASKTDIVDHINGNALDNRKENLRLTTYLINNQNARKRKDGVTSKHKGVHWCKVRQSWKAQIQLSGKKVSLGSFKTEIEAAKAYNNALDKFNSASPKNVL